MSSIFNPNLLNPQPAPAPKTSGWYFRKLFILSIIGTVIVTILGGTVLWYFSRDLPAIITAADYRPLGVTRVLGGGGREDQLLAEFYKERRYVVPYEKIPETVVQAFISAEDDSFFEHQGINLVAIIRAGIANFRAGHVVQGGSTITQQVAKSLLLTTEATQRTFSRKIKEVILSNRIERNLSKQQILYLYLNQIYLGHGAYGVQAAAKAYFRKDISEITLAEAAMLAGMPQAPGKYSPHLNPKKAKERQLYVLRRMYENKYVTKEQMLQAESTSLKVYKDEDFNQRYAPYLVEHIRRYLAEKYGEEMLYEQALTVAVPTTRALSKAARTNVQDGLRAVDKRIGYRGPTKRLKNLDEMENFLREQRLSLIQKKFGYTLFLPDGRTDPIEVIREAGLRDESQLLDVGGIYPAVVTRPDDKVKSTSVVLGAIKAELPLDKMSWAKPVREEGSTYPVWSSITPSKLFQKGDVILVKVLEANEKKVVVALEQDPLVQGAVFSLESQTGYVLAMEGGFDFEKSEFNRAFQALRQPGSAFKPFIYGAGLEKGYTPATVIVDSPIVLDDGDNGTWKPKNFETKFYGDTTYRQALIKSRNIPTIKIVQDIRVSFLHEYAKRIGLQGQFPQDLSISLGSGSVSLVELTKSYALFPRLGRKVEPVFFMTIHDRDGKLLEEKSPHWGWIGDQRQSGVLASVASPSPSPKSSAAGSGLPMAEASPSPSVTPQRISLPNFPTAEDPDQVIDPRVAYVMTHLMKEVVNYGTGQEAKQLQRPAAGKTGTTNDYIDAWFMGFTPHVVTGVWVGYDSQKTIGPSETGARAALPIWLGFMKEAIKPYPDTDFAIPNGVVYATIDPTNGKLASSSSSSAIKEAFIEGTEPTDVSTGSAARGESHSDFLKEDSE